MPKGRRKGDPFSIEPNPRCTSMAVDLYTIIGSFCAGGVAYRRRHIWRRARAVCAAPDLFIHDSIGPVTSVTLASETGKISRRFDVKEKSSSVVFVGAFWLRNMARCVVLF